MAKTAKTTRGKGKAKSGSKRKTATAKAAKEAPKEAAASESPEQPKRRVGRPSKYDPAMCESVIDLGSQGKSKAQIAAALGVSRMTLERWEDAHEEFRDAITHARDLALAWWEDTGQAGIFMGSQSFNASAFAFQMRNRFKAEYGGTDAAAVAVNVNGTGTDSPRPPDNDHLSDLGSRFSSQTAPAPTAASTDARH